MASCFHLQIRRFLVFYFLQKKNRSPFHVLAQEISWNILWFHMEGLGRHLVFHGLLFGVCSFLTGLSSFSVNAVLVSNPILKFMAWSSMNHRRICLRNALDQLSDFVIEGARISFRHVLETLEAEETFCSAPSDIVDAARRVLTLDLDRNLSEIVHDNITLKIGGNCVPLFAMVSGGPPNIISWVSFIFFLNRGLSVTSCQLDHLVDVPDIFSHVTIGSSSEGFRTCTLTNPSPFCVLVGTRPTIQRDIGTLCPQTTLSYTNAPRFDKSFSRRTLSFSRLSR